MSVEEIAVVVTLLVILGEVVLCWLVLLYRVDKLVLPTLMLLLLTVMAAFFLPLIVGVFI